MLEKRQRTVQESRKETEKGKARPRPVGHSGAIDARANQGVVVGHGGAVQAGRDVVVGDFQKNVHFSGSGTLFERQPVPPPDGWKRLETVRRLRRRLEDNHLLILSGVQPGRLNDLAFRFVSVATERETSAATSVGRNLLEWKGSGFKEEDLRRELDELHDGKAALLLFRDLGRDDLGRLVNCVENWLVQTKHRIVVTVREGRARVRLDAVEIERHWVEVDGLWSEIFPPSFLENYLTRELSRRGLARLDDQRQVALEIGSPSRIETFVDDLARRAETIDEEGLADLVKRAASPQEDLIRTYREAAHRDQRLMVCMVLVDGMALDQALAVMGILLEGPRIGLRDSVVDVQDLHSAAAVRLLQSLEHLTGRLQVRQELDVERLFDLAWQDHRLWLSRALASSAAVLHSRGGLEDGRRMSTAWQDIPILGTQERFRRLVYLHARLLRLVGVRSRDDVSPFLFALAQSSVRNSDKGRSFRSHSYLVSVQLRDVSRALLESLSPEDWVAMAHGLLADDQIGWWLDHLGTAGRVDEETNKMREEIAFGLGAAVLDLDRESLPPALVDFLKEFFGDERLSATQLSWKLSDLIDSWPGPFLETVQTFAAHREWRVRHGVAEALCENYDRLPKEYLSWWRDVVGTSKANVLTIGTLALTCVERLRVANTEPERDGTVIDYRTLLSRHENVRKDVCRLAFWLDWKSSDGVDRAFAELALRMDRSEWPFLVEQLVRGHSSLLHSAGRSAIEVDEDDQGASEGITAIERMAKSWLYDADEEVLRRISVLFYLAVLDLDSEKQVTVERLTRELKARQPEGVVEEPEAAGGIEKRPSTQGFQLPWTAWILIWWVARNKPERVLLSDVVTVLFERNLLSTSPVPEPSTRPGVPGPRALSPEREAERWLATHGKHEQLIHRWRHDEDMRPLGDQVKRFVELWQSRGLLHYAWVLLALFGLALLMGTCSVLLA